MYEDTAFQELIVPGKHDWSSEKAYQLGRMSVYSELKEILEFTNGG